MKHPFQAILLFMALTMTACQTVPPPALPTAVPPVATQAPKPATPAPTQPVVVERPPDDKLTTISTKARITAPNVPVADERELAQGNNAFAIDLYHALPAQNNLFFSPFSISQALAMTYTGARGHTEQQMAKTLHFTLPQDRLHPAFNALDLALRPSGATPAEGQFQLNIANSLWGQTGYAFQPAFLDLLAENYGAGLRLTDYKTAPEPARQAINQWVSDQTKDKIKDLIPAGAITPDTRLVLANAIYFYAKWLYPFDGSLTRPGNFNLLDGTTVSVPMMSLGHIAGLRYATGSGFQAVELPYAGEKMALTLIVPDAGRLAEVRAALTASQLEAVWSSLETKQVQLTLPKFKYESSFSLGQTLSDLGMPDALTPNVADFSGMDGTRDLVISDILHKAVVAVDEDGTEAAAATAVIVGVTSLPVIDVQLTVDRPFIFVIRDTQTGTVLFMGQVVNPK
jgi:serpin B